MIYLCKEMSLVAFRRVGMMASRSRTWRKSENVVRTYRTTKFCAVKKFVEAENSVMYSVLKAKPECSNTLMQFTEPQPVDSSTFEKVIAHNWILESPEKVYSAFTIISTYGPQHGHEITEEVFDNICDSVKTTCKTMSDEHLMGVLVNLRRWPQTKFFKSRNFDLWMAVDSACVARVNDWDKPKLLLVADHFYRLHLVRKSRFMVKGLRKLCRKPQQLTPAQLVQIMFYINSHRQPDSLSDMFDVEYALQNCADVLSVEDLAVVAAGYFKSEKKIRSERLLRRMAEATGAGAATTHDVTLTALLKSMRYSLPLSMLDQLYNMQERLLPHVSRFSLMTCTHAALVGTNAQVLHERLVLAVAERFAREASGARAKDLERMALALGLFDVEPRTQPCIFEVLQRELRDPARHQEMLTHPKCAPRTLYFLSLKRLFPLDLLQQVFLPDNILRTFGAEPHGYELELLALDMNLSLECPAYQGHRLDPKTRAIIAKRFRMRLPLLEKPERGALTDRLLGQLLVAVTEAAGGPQKAAARHVLPHHVRANVFVRVDAAASAEAGRAVFLPLPQWLLEESPGGEPRPAPADDDGALWFALVLAGWNNYLHGDGAGRFVATTSALLRQLAILGYRPVVVPWQEWNKLPAAGRADHIRRLLREEVSKAGAAASASSPAPAASDTPAAGAL